MKYRTLTALSLAGLLLTGCASTPDKSKPAESAPPPPPPSVATGAEVDMGEVITLTATVQAIDLENRLVTLKGERGRVMTVNVGEEARNLEQVKVGDRVVITYREAMAIELVSEPTSGGVTERRSTLSGTRAELGQRPSATLRDKTEIVANVIAVNKKTRRVTLQGPQHAVTVKVSPDIDLSQVRVGDQVRVVYVEEFGINVTPAPKKPKKK
jgi:Cu/Ag efflux protein CusF